MTATGEAHLPTLPQGHRLGHYEILRVLGSGGMGQVYQARDLRLERMVALKCPNPDLAQDPAFRNRFMREAKAASAVSHPNIVQVFDVIEADGLPWTVMEFIDGTTLRSLLSDGRPRPTEEILRHAEGLAGGLDTAHRRGILHRDIKPSNVLVGKDGRARLNDFGLAKRVLPAAGSPPDITRTLDESHPGTVMGTAGYMGPEQALGRPLDQRADIFSLGTVLYEMCTGRPAFAVSSLGDVLDAVLHREPVSIAHLNPDIPPELVRIVGKCLAKRPDERYQTAQDLASDIRALHRKVDSDPTHVIDEGRRRFSRRPAWPLGSVGAVAMIATIGSIAYWTVPHPSAGEPVPAFTNRRLTSGPGWEAHPALSPDGTLVAYTAAEGSAQSDIWLLDVRGGEPLRLTEDPAADTSPAWFPDGIELAFVSDRGSGASIWKVPRLGGSAVLLVPDAQDPAISPDGRTIAFARRGTSGHFRIYVAPIADPERATALTGDGDGLWEHLNPAWSHDGRTICYETWAGLWTVPSAGGTPRRLTPEAGAGRAPAWSADDRFVYFASALEAADAIWRVPAGGGEPQRVTLGTGPETQPSIAGDGSLLGYSTYTDLRTIVALDRTTGQRARLENLKVAQAPAFAPDGSALFFSSPGRRQADLWTQPLAGGRPHGPPKRLTDMPGEVATLAVSPDNRWVAFHRNLDHRRDIWIMPAGGGVAVNFTNDPGLDVHPAWSPDGGSLAFTSDRDGRQHIWVAPVSEGRPAGPAWRLTTGDALDVGPAWSPDGRTIAFVRVVGNRSEIHVVAADGGGEPRQVTHDALACHAAWERRGDALLVSGTWRTPWTEIRRVRLAGGEPVPLDPPVRFGNDSSLGAFCLSSDGRFIAYVEEAQRGNIWALETAGGWR